jgi:two-component system, NtrC family, sensor kinase
VKVLSKNITDKIIFLFPMGKDKIKLLMEFNVDEKYILNIIKFIPFFYIISFIMAYVGYCMYFDIEFKKDITIILFFLILALSVLTLYISKITKNKFQNFKLNLINNENIKLENIKNILEELPIIVIYKDLNDFILTVNKEALTQFSISLENIINKPAKEIFPISFQDQYKNDIDIIKTKKGKFNLIERLMINNKLRIVRTSRVPIFDEFNNVKNIIIFMIDITKKVKLENEQIKKNKLLYQQSKMASLGQIIGDITHQWRQTLSILSTASTGIKLKKEMGILEDSELLSTMDLINKSTQNLSNTIDDFRNFLNPSNSKTKKFNIKQTIEQTLKILNVQFLSKNIRIIQNIEDIEIISLEDQLILVFINILNNAIDALTNLDSSIEKLILINCYKKNNYLIIEIQDNANGIDESIIDEIFELYFSTKTLTLDSGIGLYITMMLITNILNGEIYAENKKFTYKNNEYYGAKFTIMLQEKALSL